MALLTRIEEILSIPMEVIHNRRGFQPVDVARRAVRSMEQGARKGIHKTYAPNQFHVLLSTGDYEELYPFVEMVCSEVKGELRRIIEERDYLLAGELSVDVLMDDNLEKGKFEVEGRMVSDTSPSNDMPTEPSDPTVQVDQPSLDRDAGTVIMMPDNHIPQSAVVEKGVTLLKEGHAREALTVLSEAQEDLDGEPGYHAAMAVALDMNQKREEALPHYRRLRAIDGPQPLVQRRLEWAARTASSSAISDVGTAGIQVGPEGPVLMNPNLSDKIRVDDKVSASVVLTPGCQIRIGDLLLTARKG